MKPENIIKKTIIRIGFVGALALASFQQSMGAEPRKNVSKEIEELRDSITFIDLYTITTPISYRIDLTVQDVIRRGCQYSATDKGDVATLIDVLVDAQLSEPSEKIFLTEPRIVVSLHMNNGEVHTLSLSQEFSEAATRGTYDNDVIITARRGFAHELRQWRRAHKPIRWSDLTCTDI
jgi:hypothetical protein